MPLISRRRLLGTLAVTGAFLSALRRLELSRYGESLRSEVETFLHTVRSL